MIRTVTLCAIVLFLPSGCGEPATPAVRVATTTSVDNSGLLPFLAREFEAQTGIRIEPFVVGSGKAFAMAREGLADVTITHEPAGEEDLRRDGFVVAQEPFAENRFLLVGPPENPARIPRGATVVEAMRLIHDAGARFVSRADESGTHVRELELWRLAERSPRENRGYMELGQGMSALLRSASELGAYTLADEATFARMAPSVRLVPTATHGERLQNVYVVTLVRGRDGEPSPSGIALFEWLGSAAGRRAIESFVASGGSGFAPVPGRF